MDRGLFKGSSRMSFRIIEGEGFIVDSSTQMLHHLNCVGARIWELLDGKSGVDSFASRLCAEFEVDRETALRDIASFLNVLAEKGLIERTP